ncbi:MAG TPA: DNA/RNA helicase domain-containing protein, partial [Clostridia bacterium]
HRKNVRFVAPNAAFRSVMLDQLSASHARSKAQINDLFEGSSGFWDTPANAYDILVVDEAHRLKRRGAYMYKGQNQVDDIIRSSRISILFIDDRQQIRPDDVGTTDEIRKYAVQYQAELVEMELTAQFRCAGAEGFLNWIDDVLQIQETGNFSGWDQNAFEFDILDSPHDVYRIVREKQESQMKARMLAGFAWDWTPAHSNPKGEVNDVIIPEYDFAMPWNQRQNSSMWAVLPEGIRQIGCILTEFEYFKVRFSELLSPDRATYFNVRIDQAWSDLFWDLFKDDRKPDIAQKVYMAIMRFLRYLTDMQAALTKADATDAADDFAIFRALYTRDKHVVWLFAVLDALVDIYQNRPNFFSSLFYPDTEVYTPGKTKLFFRPAFADLFMKCSDRYDPTQRINPFSIGEQLLLYACITHLLNSTLEVNARIRTLRNMISQSADILRNENLPSLLQAVTDFMIGGNLDICSSFNASQLGDEKAKLLFLQQYPDLQETVECLEDHRLLQGCLAILRLTPDLADNAAQFHGVFHTNCNYDEISQALLTFGDYSQKYGTKRRFGNMKESVWQDLFAPSQRKGEFGITQDILQQLLDALKADPTLTLSMIIEFWRAQYEVDPAKERDWRYYYIVYPEFREYEQGYYYLPDATKPFERFKILSIEWGGKHWDPCLLAIKNAVGQQVSLGNYGDPLIYGLETVKIYNKQKGFSLEADADNADGQALLKCAVMSGLITPEFTCSVQQSAGELDTENRVKKGIELINALERLKVSRAATGVTCQVLTGQS